MTANTTTIMIGMPTNKLLTVIGQRRKDASRDIAIMRGYGVSSKQNTGDGDTHIATGVDSAKDLRGFDYEQFPSDWPENVPRFNLFSVLGDDA